MEKVLPSVNVAQFNENGFLILRNVFSAAEMESFRERCYRQLEADTGRQLNYNIGTSKARSLRGDLLSKEYIRDIVLDERVVHVAKQLLGEDVVYFGDSNFQFGEGLRGYHRDNVDRQYNSGPDWNGEYPLIRFGLYMQDHSRYSGGLKVRRGSHRNNSGKSIILDTKVGDLVVWSLKTLHSGNAVRLKLFPNLPVDILENKIPRFLRKAEDKERIACFFTFGKRGEHLNRYLSEYLLKAAPAVENLKNSPLAADTLSTLASRKIELLKPIPEYGS